MLKKTKKVPNKAVEPQIAFTQVDKKFFYYFFM
jgi:hypothetical protein